MPAWDAIVLAGGRARRMGGIDKTAIKIDGVSILDRVRAGLVGAARIQIVGPEVSGGPVAALASAVARVSAPVVVTLAGDQPWVAGGVGPLLDGLGDADVAVLTSEGRRHYLAAAWDADSLRTALGRLGDPVDAPVRALFDGVRITEVVDVGGWSRDIDAPEDLISQTEVD